MKNQILLTALIAVFGITFIQAQDSVEFGAKGGVNFASFSGDGFDAFDDPETRTSFNLGLVAEIPFGTRFSVQPEVLYSGQGFDIQQNEDADDVEFQLAYINVPVLAKVYLVDGLYAAGGPQIGFNVNSEIDDNPDGNGGDIQVNEDIVNDIDLSLAFGAGYKFVNGFFIDARYNAGLTDVFDEDEVGFEVDAKNAVFQVGVGFFF